MDKRFFIIMLVLVLASFGFSGCIGSTSTEYVNEEYEVNENTILKVSTINGQIEVIGWDGDMISFNAIKKTKFDRNELDYIEIDVEQNEGEINIEAYYTGNRQSQPSVDMNIKIPEHVIVDQVSTSNGAIDISDVKGDIVAKTSNGGIFIDNVDGFVKASTSNGKIEIKDTKGVIDLTSSNLGIDAEIFDFNEDIEISTSNGGIILYINPSLNADLEISTSNGYITIDDALGIILSLSEEKHKEGQLGTGGDTIDIHTSNGNIKLFKLEI